MMKKMIFLASFITVGICYTSAQEITVEGLKDNSINLGSAKQNATLEKSLLVKNTGDKPLIISSVQGSCSCTVTDYSKTPIQPGKTGYITVKQATSAVGNFTKTVTIMSNDVVNPKKQITVTGEVVQ